MQQKRDLRHFVLVENTLKDSWTGVGPYYVDLALYTNLSYLRLPHRGVGPYYVDLALYTNLSYLRLPHRAVWWRLGRRRFSSPVCWS